MTSLERLREQLAAVDEQLLAQFVRRMHLVDEVAEEKKARQSKVFVPEQEMKVMGRATAKVPADLAEFTEVLVATLLRLSRVKQYDRLIDTDDSWSLGHTLQAAERDLVVTGRVLIPSVMDADTRRFAADICPDAELVAVPSGQIAWDQLQQGRAQAAIFPCERKPGHTWADIYAFVHEHALYIQACSVTDDGQIRSLAVGPQLTIPSRSRQVSVCVHLAKECSLTAVLSTLADLKLDLTGIYQAKRYVYYLDFLAQPINRNALRALYQLEQETESLSLLGWYPTLS